MFSAASPSFLSQHRGVLYFRMRVPKDLQEPLGNKEYRRSLGTASRREARPKALRLAVIIYELFNTARDINKMYASLEVQPFRGAPSVEHKLTLEKAKELARISLDRALNASYRSNLLSGPFTPEQKHQMNITLMDSLLETLQNVDLVNTPPDIEEEADDLLLEHGIANPKFSAIADEDDQYSYRLLCDRLLRAKAAVLESQLAGPCWDGSLRVSEQVCVSMASGFIPKQSEIVLPSLQYIPQAQQALPSEISIPPKIMTLREAVEKRLGESSGNWRSKATPLDKKNLFETFLSILGEDLPITELNRDAIRRYYTVLTSIPAQYKKKKEYAGLSFDELIDLNVPAEKRFKRESLQNNFNAVKGFLSWAEDEGLIERTAPLKKILNKLPEDAGGGEKRAFTNEELSRLFAPEQFMTKKEALDRQKPWKFLVPVIGLFTGARIEEICQLELDDIRLDNGSEYPEDKGIWYIHITNENRSGSGKNKSVKTKAGIRKIPLHPFLLGENGSPVNLLAYVEKLRRQGETRLFPMLRPNKRGVVSDSVSKGFTRYRRKCGVGAEADKNSSVTFHSFRHTVITTATKLKEVDRRKVKQMVGHEAGLNDSSDITTRYEGDYPLSTIKRDVIGALDFDVTLNLYAALQGWRNAD